MNSSPEDFENIRRLLALKRHEQPPPGYFHYLPDQIISKIERRQTAEHSTWWEWLVARFDAKPILACTYGFAVSGLLLMGFRLSQMMETEAASASGGHFGGTWFMATSSDLADNLSHSFGAKPLENRMDLGPFSASGPMDDSPSIHLTRYNSHTPRFIKSTFMASP